MCVLCVEGGRKVQRKAGRPTGVLVNIYGDTESLEVADLKVTVAVTRSSVPNWYNCNVFFVHWQMFSLHWHPKLHIRS